MRIHHFARILLRGLAATTLVVSALGASTAWADPGHQPVPPRHVRGGPISPSATLAPGVSGSGPLIDHGGFLLSQSQTHLIFWGPLSSWPSDAPAGLIALFQGFNGSGYLQTTKQYFRGASPTTSLVSAVNDQAAPPYSGVTPEMLGQEVQRIYGANVEPNGVYVIYTSTFASDASGSTGCGWHSWAYVNNTYIPVVFVPNSTNIPRCDPGNSFNAPGSQGLRALANVSAHELVEAITDPYFNGWYDTAGSEIADKCAWVFEAPVYLPNNTQWQLQDQWSNRDNGCITG